MTHLPKNCVTMNEFMDKFYEKNELSHAICEECSKMSGKISRANFEKHQSVLKPSMILRIFLQRSEYNVERDEYWKNRTQFSLPSQYSKSFSDIHDEVVYFIVAIKIYVGKDMDSGHYVCAVLDYNKATWWN